MSAQTAVARARAAAEALMLDTATITRVTGQTTDPETGVVTPTTTTVYTGKCKIQQRSVSASRTDVGEASVLLLALELHIPVSVTGVHADDLATITASQDPDLVGRMLRIVGEAHKTLATARRYQVTEVTS